MATNLSSLLPGIQLILGAQLIAVAALHLLAKGNRSKVWLSILCLIYGLWFFKHVFAYPRDESLMLFLLIGPGKPIFVGAILMFHYKTLTSHLSRQALVFHLSIPAVYYVTLVLTRFFLKDHFSSEFELLISIGFSLWTLAIFWYYFFLTHREIIINAKTVLIPRAYSRVRLLFYSLYFFLLQIPLWDILDKLDKHGALNGFDGWLQVASGWVIALGYNAAYGYLHFLAYFVFLYSLSELPYLKKYLLPRQTRIDDQSLAKQNELNRKLSKFLYEDKVFKNPNLTVQSFAAMMDISRNELINHFKLVQKSTFKDFINRLRVEEVKQLIHDDHYAKYDLTGIALECGFSSKSTFQRVFKEKEGMTPGEFKARKAEMLDSNRSAEPV